MLLADVLDKQYDARMKEQDEEEPMEVTKDDFEDTVHKFARKNKRSYDFLTKSGASFQNSVFKLCKSFQRKI